MVLLSLGIALSRALAAEKADQRMVDDVRLTELSRSGGLSSDDQLELALAWDERGQVDEAAVHYAAAAAADVGVAELRLGAMCETGRGQPQSYEAARAHYERAVQLGLAEANLRLGLLYLEGWGVTADATAAVTHIEQAANAGYEPAEKILADMYFSGVKVPRDLAKALAWEERAAARKDPEAQTRMGAIRQATIKRPEDVRLAREWYQLSAEQDYTRGMLAMAATFLKPGADPASVGIGIRWLKLAAEGGNSAAAFHLAGFHLLRRGSAAAEVAPARALLQQAAAGGEASAQEVLQEEAAGRPLAAAFAYVIQVPYDVRYVQRAERVLKKSADGVEPPHHLKLVKPIYPAALRLAKVTGTAMVEFVVDTSGRVRDAKTIESSHPGFAESAAAAVAQWRFIPAIKDGRRLLTRMRVPVYFQFSDLGRTDAWSASARQKSDSTEK